MTSHHLFFLDFIRSVFCFNLQCILLFIAGISFRCIRSSEWLGRRFLNIIYGILVSYFYQSTKKQDVNEELSVKYPSLYMPGQKGSLFNRKEFLFSVMHGIISSIVLFFIPYGTMFQSVDARGKDAADLQSFGFAVATILVVVVNLQVHAYAYIYREESNLKNLTYFNVFFSF
jgi:magnesium-transporting ATPase (P-type)